MCPVLPSKLLRRRSGALGGGPRRYLNVVRYVTSPTHTNEVGGASLCVDAPRVSPVTSEAGCGSEVFHIRGTFIDCFIVG